MIRTVHAELYIGLLAGLWNCEVVYTVIREENICGGPFAIWRLARLCDFEPDGADGQGQSYLTFYRWIYLIISESACAM